MICFGKRAFSTVKAIFLCLCVLPKGLKHFLKVLVAMGLGAAVTGDDGIALTPPTPTTSPVPAQHSDSKMALLPPAMLQNSVFSKDEMIARPKIVPVTP